MPEWRSLTVSIWQQAEAGAHPDMHRTQTIPPRQCRRPLELLAMVLVCVSQLALAGDPPVPLSELGTSLWRGWQGGLYPEGANDPPPAHLERAQRLADGIEPLDAAGQPYPDGWLGMVSLGMSNASQEFKVLERLLDSDEGVNPSLRIVNAAQGSIPAEAIADPNHAFWNLAFERVVAAGLSPAQVQVCWIKQALGTVSDPTFPHHVLLLESHLASIARNHAALGGTQRTWPRPSVMAALHKRLGITVPHGDRSG